jgi:hypothetical protein
MAMIVEDMPISAVFINDTFSAYFAVSEDHIACGMQSVFLQRSTYSGRRIHPSNTLLAITKALDEGTLSDVQRPRFLNCLARDLVVRIVLKSSMLRRRPLQKNMGLGDAV